MHRLGCLRCLASLLVVGLLTVAHAPRPAHGAAPFVWIESETPTSANLPTKPASTGHDDWLSGGKWLFVGIESQDVAKQLPADGALLKYAFTATVNANYEIWNRVGMEFIRSPFELRIDQGEWTTVTSRDPKFQTIDLMELATWNEVAWLRLGQQPISKGDHTLEIRLPTPPKDDKGAPGRVIYASDCLCLSAGPFHPRLEPQAHRQRPHARRRGRKPIRL